MMTSVVHSYLACRYLVRRYRIIFTLRRRSDKSNESEMSIPCSNIALQIDASRWTDLKRDRTTDGK
ncbi:MAG: hypothetical protein KDB00_25635 [Planctomycetales bacterium]|nr:hypothetical protein [Planctomycetales bacterium]